MAYIALIRAMEATLHSRHYSSKLDLRVVIVNWNIRVNQDYLHMSATSRAYYIDSCGSIGVNATTYLYMHGVSSSSLFSFSNCYGIGIIISRCPVFPQFEPVPCSLGRHMTVYRVHWSNMLRETRRQGAMRSFSQILNYVHHRVYAHV